MSTPTERTLKAEREAGHLPCIVERWISVPFTKGGGHRMDAFGFGDILSVRWRGTYFAEIALLQSCEYSSISARCRKIATECTEAALAWLEAGGHIEVVGWKKGVRAGSGTRGNPRIIIVGLDDNGKLLFQDTYTAKPIRSRAW